MAGFHEFAFVPVRIHVMMVSAITTTFCRIRTWEHSRHIVEGARLCTKANTSLTIPVFSSTTTALKVPENMRVGKAPAGGRGPRTRAHLHCLENLPGFVILFFPIFPETLPIAHQDLLSLADAFLLPPLPT